MGPDHELFKLLSEKYSLIKLDGKNPKTAEGTGWSKYCHKKRAFKDIGFRPGQNAGIACGPASGIIAVDVDDIDLFQQTCAKNRWNVPETLTHETGSGNLHIIYRYPSNGHYGNKANKGLGFDIRGVGGQIVAPGSIHPETGKPYFILHDRAIADAPQWILDLCNGVSADGSGKKQERIDGESILNGVGKGERDDKLYRYACSLRAKNIGRIEAELLVRTAAANCSPPFPEREAMEKLRQAWKHDAGSSRVESMATEQAPEATTDKQEPPRERGKALTDIGNGERFATVQRGKAIFCHPWGEWFIWDGSRWKLDNCGAVMQLGKKTVRGIYQEARDCTDDSLREATAKWAIKCESRAKLEAMIAMGKSEPGIPVAPEDLDRDDWLLNCQNGTVDLRSGSIIPHNPEHKITKIVNTFFNPIAECPTWLKFLDEVLDGNQETIDFLRRAAGYSLTGDNSEHCLFMLYGTGRNGKSTFLDTLKLIWGDYARQSEISTFLEKKNEGVREDVADLRGSRMVIAMESDKGHRLAENIIKEMTGGGTMSARFLYGKRFEFEPRFKIWFAVNHKPIIRGTDEGIWSRIRLVPFTVYIPPEKRDKRLKDKLIQELPGILNWAISGCKEWRENLGLGNSEKVCAATEAYKGEMDTIGAFLREVCMEGDGMEIPKAVLYQAYTTWCEQGGDTPISKKQFGTCMIERPGVTDGRTNSMRIWRGVDIR
ncbi:MAG: phage/plasmid primase, P4 family [Syntrophobacteraceae bacterium]